MGAPRVTPEEIVEMHRLYKKYGTFAAVAREMGRSSQSVSKYIKMRSVPDNIKLAAYNLMAEMQKGL